MHIKMILLSAVAATLISGCDNHDVSKYKALNNVPASKLKTFKQKLQDAPVAHIELPTHVPFTVTDANVQYIGSQVLITLSNDAHTLLIQVFPPNSNNNSIAKAVIEPNEKITSLADGSQALYGYNGRFSELSWIQRGSVYSLDSTTAKHKRDLTDNQLVSVANSFK